MRVTSLWAAALRPASRWLHAPALPAGLSAFFVLLTLGLQMWPGASQLLRFSRLSYEQGALWQLFSAQWVHLSDWHAGANALAFALIVVASRPWIGWPLQLLALCGGYIGVALVVALDANCSYYAGASGALHGLLAGNAAGVLGSACVRVLAAGDGGGAASVWAVRRCLGALAVLAGMALKLWLQAASVPPAPVGGWGFAVYHPAHVAGALGGMGLVLVLLAARSVRAAKAQAQRCQ